MNQKQLPLELLSEEHKDILKVIFFLEKEAHKIELGGAIDKVLCGEIIHFITNFADKIHHAKEEDILFREFCREEVIARTHCNPVQQMLYEHELGRDFVKKMEEGLAEGDNKRLVIGANGYAQLLIEHINKEENILYPMIEEAIKPEEMLKVKTEFRKVGEKFAEVTKKSKQFVKKIELLK